MLQNCQEMIESDPEIMGNDENGAEMARSGPEMMRNRCEVLT